MKKIGISFGHNDKYNVGANGFLNEDKINKEVGEILIKKLNEGGKCQAIRLYKDNVKSFEDSIYYRPNLANSLGCDIAIDIHHNAYTDERAHGCEALGTGSNSELLANHILNEVQKLGYFNRGFKYNNYAFNSVTIMPSVIYEGFFITNRLDCNKYNADAEAKAIAQGIYNFLNLGSVSNSSSEEKIYTTVEGDNLTTIGKKLNVSVDHLVNKNNIKNPNVIGVGQALKYDVKEKSYNVYEVKEGESLWSISQKLKVDFDYLVNINKITNPSLIFPKQILKY